MESLHIQPNALTQACGKSCTHDTRRFRTSEPQYHKDWSSSERAETGTDIQGDEKAKKGCEVDTWLPQGRYYWAHATAALCGGLATQVDTTSAAHIPEPRIGGSSATRLVCALIDASHCHRIAKWAAWPIRLTQYQALTCLADTRTADTNVC